MERAAGLVLPAGLGEWHPRADDLDNVRALDEVVNEVLGNTTTHDRCLPLLGALSGGWFAREVYFPDRRALTRSPMVAKSARPWAFSRSAAMTLPISFMELAPVAAMTSPMRASSSAGDRASGR